MTDEQQQIEPQPEEQQHLVVVEGIGVANQPLETNQGEKNRFVEQFPPVDTLRQSTLRTSSMPPFQINHIYEYAMQGINIPDSLNFEHVYVIKNPWFSGTYEEYSSFTIPGLGMFNIGYQLRKSLGFMLSPMKQVYRPGRFEYNYHFYDEPDYRVQSLLVSMEYWNNGLGVVRVANLPVIEFISAKPNFSDAFYGHCKSGFPKIQLRFPLGNGKPDLYLEPDPSPCPESCLASDACFALCGLCTNERHFSVRGLTTGRVTIFNTRLCSEACAKVFLCQGRLGYPQVDYPRFIVNFDNTVPQIDRLAIVMGLIHYSYFKKWYIIAHISHSALGLG